MRRRYVVIAASVLAVAAGGVGIAQAVGGDDDEASVEGPQADRAKAAALGITKGGTANSVEHDGENGATWEVEVTRPDGSTVDVRLDESYRHVVTEGDDETNDSDSD